MVVVGRNKAELAVLVSTLPVVAAPRCYAPWPKHRCQGHRCHSVDGPWIDARIDIGASTAADRCQ